MELIKIKNLINKFPRYRRGDRIYFTDIHNINCCAMVEKIDKGIYHIWFTGHYVKETGKYMRYNTDINQACMHEVPYKIVHSTYKLGDGTERATNRTFKEI